jgi:hypothetical protein
MSMNRRQFIKTLSLIALSTGLLPREKARATAGSKLSVEDTPVVLECGINGSTTKKKNPNAPETVQEHIAEMMRVLDSGATIAHNHSNQHSEDPVKAAQFYADVFRPVRKKHPHSILYATVNMDAKALHEERRPWAPGKMSAHHRVLAKAGLANMVLFETGVSAVSLFDEDGVAKEDIYFVYQFWPEDIRYTRALPEDDGRAGSEMGGFLPRQRRKHHGYAVGPNGAGARWEPSSRSRGRYHWTEKRGADQAREGAGGLGRTTDHQWAGGNRIPRHTVSGGPT